MHTDSFISSDRIRTPYDRESMAVRYCDVHFGDEPSLTIQSAANECDINMIIERANRGIFPSGADKVPRFGDFSAVADYQSALNMVDAARDQFSLLPAKVRARFDNDPAKLLGFLANEANRQEAIDLGLVPKPPEAPTAPVAAPAVVSSVPEA